MPFENWTGNIKNPVKIHYPKNNQDLRHFLSEAKSGNLPLRVVGATHTQSPAICDNNEACVLISLRHYQLRPKNIVFDHELRQVTVNAGWSLATLYDHLNPHRYFLDTQTAGSMFIIGGIVTMPVHGARLGAGCIADGVVALELMRSDGEIFKIRETDPDFNVYRISLGAMGILLSVTFRLRYYPSVKNKVRYLENVFVSGLPNREVLTHFYQGVWNDCLGTKTIRYHHTFLDMYNNRILTLDWTPKSNRKWHLDFPETQKVTVLTLPGPRQNHLFLKLLGLAATTVISTGVKVNGWFDQDMLWLNLTDRVRFMSYFVPLPNLEPFFQALQVIKNVIDSSSHYTIDYPVDLRFVVKSPAVASPIQGEAPVFVSIEISCIADEGENWRDFFRRIEIGWQKLGGKPHYAKLFGLTNDESFDQEIIKSCLSLEAKQKLRAKAEPVFCNRFVRNLLADSDNDKNDS